jgi:hypothetical protein
MAKIQDKVSNNASNVFENQNTKAATLSKAAAVAAGVLGRGSASAAAAAARNGRVFDSQLIGQRK